MDQSGSHDVNSFYDAVASDYHQQYERDNLLSSAEYPANYHRLQILVQRLALSGARRVYEVGTGEGTPLVVLARMGFEVYGCDLASEMVKATQHNLSAAGLDPTRVCWADVQDSTTLAAQLHDGPFDAVVAAGVMPHVRNDVLVLQNIRMLLRPGGSALIEFRNKLFSLFTFNRYTKEFVLDDLLAGVADDVKAATAAELDRRVAVELPPRRERLDSGAPGYDAVLSKFHNPFEAEALFKAAGFANVRLHWYHYHPAPPMLEAALGPRFRDEALKLEHESSGWRGYFLCSAYVVEADAV